MWASSSSSQKTVQLWVSQSGAPDNSFFITFAGCVGVTGTMDEQPRKATTKRKIEPESAMEVPFRLIPILLPL
jgi:hypothetical protein